MTIRLLVDCGIIRCPNKVSSQFSIANVIGVVESLLSIFMVESIIAENDKERLIGSDLNIVETADAFFFK